MTKKKLTQKGYGEDAEMILREIDTTVNLLHVAFPMAPAHAKDVMMRLASNLGKVRNRVNNLVNPVNK